MKTYYTVDKSAWGDGPWEDEPDKLQWTDETTGLPCLVKRNPRMGFLCGYVGVPRGHPEYKADWGDVDVDVHGGLTFADGCQQGDEATSICHIPEPGQPDDVWWLGFDCGHFMDYLPGMEVLLGQPAPIEQLAEGLLQGTYKTVSYVREECARFAAQLSAIE